ncbi:MAG: YkgJ family cysteine cluster protein [Thermoplasmata archaeon]|nr:YkgJ family cysteine cluster protein [Thermoplasmata archaeon]
MSNRCLETKCIQCCKETNMLLSYHDIEKIQKLGYDHAFFLREHGGWLQLKNSQGRCVFHTGEKCTIYEHRPKGCSFYPIVYDKDNNGAILDSECPQKLCFPLIKSKIQQLLHLISTLERERNQR